MTWWNGTEEFWKKSTVFGIEWQMAFFACWLLILEQILYLDISLIRLDKFFTFNVDFIV